MIYLGGVVGVKRKNRVRNTQIREDLEVISILDFTEQRQLCWWGHTQRMDSDRMVKQVWEAKSGERKKRGRPRPVSYTHLDVYKRQRLRGRGSLPATLFIKRIFYGKR